MPDQKRGLSVRIRILFTVLVSLLLALPSAAGTVSADIACDDRTSSPATPAATPDLHDVPDFPDDGGELHVMAAASLTDAFGEMEQVLEEQHPGLDITIQTAGSQTLVTQLQSGAEADVLATANTVTMQAAVDSGLIADDPVAFAQNRLVIAAPADNPAGIESMDDLATDGASLILAGADVPAGTYARTALCAHAATTGDASAFLGRVDANIVSEEPDVRHVLTKLILGEADAGIVYASDAAAAELSGTPLTIIELPEGVSAPATYPIAPVNGGNTDLALAFIGFALSDEGQAILRTYGFE
jgi:molybdate transport system substrate-binding protein